MRHAVRTLVRHGGLNRMASGPKSQDSHKRIIHILRRKSTFHETSKSALAVEASGLRYMNMIQMNGAEDSLARGWDSCVMEEEDDGT